jgi:hypothetical protein
MRRRREGASRRIGNGEVRAERGTFSMNVFAKTLMLLAACAIAWIIGAGIAESTQHKTLLGEPIHKVLYDSLIAAIAGILAGFLVDRMIKWRDKVHWSRVEIMMYLDVLDITQSLILKIVPVEFLELTNKDRVFRGAARNCNLIEFKDADLFEYGTCSNCEFREVIMRRLPTRHALEALCLGTKPVPDSLSRPMIVPLELDYLMEAKRQLDALLPRSGFVFEPELMTLLGTFYRQIGQIIRFTESILERIRNNYCGTGWSPRPEASQAPDWKDKKIRKEYTYLLLDALRSADQMQSALYRRGRLVEVDPRLGCGLVVGVAHSSVAISEADYDEENEKEDRGGLKAKIAPEALT